jgi:maltose/moltooligosaccharide transporter
MPYAMLADAIPAQKMGFYMGVFNFFIVLPQIVAAAVLGPVVKHLFDGRALPAVVTGGVSLLVAAAALSLVPRNDPGPA